MIHFTENIDFLRRKRDLDIKDFVAILGKSYAGVHNYFTGKSEPRFDVIEKFARFFDVSISDLMGRDLRKLPARSSYKNTFNEDQASYFTQIPTVQFLPSSSGVTQESMSQIKERLGQSMPLPSFFGKVDLFVVVSGDSMTSRSDTRYTKGSYLSVVFVSNKNSLQSGKEYVLETDEGLVFKTFKSEDKQGNYIMSSINEKFADIKVPKKSVKEIGVVTGVFSHV